ncbi:hypothetical protein [Myxococcus xanthus]|uniref:hypothetical protein n=1 Tax=Myxococcus xanthus TaxID=34 RepID=UPI001396C52C|nr:hypothetical protein [Myxococcus xanthus]
MSPCVRGPMALHGRGHAATSVDGAGGQWPGRRLRGAPGARRLKAEERDAIEEALEACADDARSTVLIAMFNGRNPTPDERRFLD